MFTLSTMFTRRSITLKASVFYVLSLETFITVRRRWQSYDNTPLYYNTSVFFSILIADHKEILFSLYFIEQHASNGSLTL